MCISMKTLAVAVALASVAASGSATAQQALSVQRYQPTLDITQGLNCGQKLNTPAQRIAHNRALAELYFLNYQQDRERGRNYGWAVHNCAAAESSILLGAVEALADPHVMPARSADPALTGEQLGFFASFPDWGTVPNTLAVVPFDGGAFFRMMYAGHDTAGRSYTIWETNFILVNDEGQITHFEMWNDINGWSRSTKHAFDFEVTPDMGLMGYVAQTEAYRHRLKARQAEQ